MDEIKVILSKEAILNHIKDLKNISVFRVLKCLALLASISIMIGFFIGFLGGVFR